MSNRTKIRFRNNPNLRPADYVQEWTEKEMAEWSRCRNDPIYFIEGYVHIVNRDGNLEPIKLYDWQKKIILDYVNESRTIVVTSRQSGKSTTTVSFILWYIIFHSHKTCAIVANKEMVAAEMIWKIQLAYEKIPYWMQMGIAAGGWNKKSLTLENGSRVIAAATSASSISGFTVDFLMIDEVAKVEIGKWDAFWTATSQTLSGRPNAKVAMISTPLGLNHFWEFWDKAVRGINGYKHHSIPWHMVPGRGKEWKQQVLSDLNFDEDKFAQEHCCSFNGSSGTLIVGWKIKAWADQGVIDPLVNIGGIKQYEPAKPGHRYVICADVGEGKGLDYSACSVIDITAKNPTVENPFRQVATFYDNSISWAEYAQVLQYLGRHFNNAMILVENNAIGSSVVNHLWEELEYDNLLFTKAGKKKGGRARPGAGGLDVVVGAIDGAEGGVRTTTKTKHIGCQAIKRLIEHDHLIINDSQTMGEFSTFSRKFNKSTGQYGDLSTCAAEPGKHDDLVMGCVLFAWLTQSDLFAHIDIKTFENLRERTEEEMDDTFLPFFFYNDGNATNEDELAFSVAPMIDRGEDTKLEQLKNWPTVWSPNRKQ